MLDSQYRDVDAPARAACLLVAANVARVCDPGRAGQCMGTERQPNDSLPVNHHVDV